MNVLKSYEATYIPGRGMVYLVNLGNISVTVGEVVRLDGLEFKIKAIERSVALTDPPKFLPQVGLLGFFLTTERLK